MNTKAVVASAVAAMTILGGASAAWADSASSTVSSTGSSTASSTPDSALSTAAPGTTPPAPAPTACDPDSHWPAYVQGANNKFDAGDDGYYLWHYLKGGWGLRVSHPRLPGEANHVHFTGTITSAGMIKDVKPVRLEKNDKVVVGPGGHTLFFSFNNYGGVDGVDFATTCTPGLKVEMKVDGTDFPLRFIHLGARGVHPQSNPFLVRRVDTDTGTAPAGSPTAPPTPVTGQASS